MAKKTIDRGIGNAVLGLTQAASPLFERGGLEREPRPLDPAERALAERALGGAIDLDPVRIVRARSPNTWVPREGHVARAIGNVVFMPELDGDLHPRTLVHELCHVVQFQRGGTAYIGDSVRAQLGAQLGGKSRNEAYDWRMRLAEGVRWADMGAECQAQLVSDCWDQQALEPKAAEALAEARAGRGWCGAPE